MKRYQVALDAALFNDPRFSVTRIGPFVLAIRSRNAEIDTIAVVAEITTLTSISQRLVTAIGPFVLATRASTTIYRRGRWRGQLPNRADRRDRRRPAGRRAGAGHSAASRQADHRTAELAAERRLLLRHRAADLLRGDGSGDHGAVSRGGWAGGSGECGQDGAAVHRAQAGAEGRRPRAADPAGRRQPPCDRPQHTRRHRPDEPSAQPGLPTTDVHRACRQGHRRVRRPGQGAGQRRPRGAAQRGARRLRLPPADRRRLHRPIRSRTARPEFLGHDRHAATAPPRP